MKLFNKENDEEELIEEEKIPSRKFKDLKPENKKRRKEPPKPWGKFERLFVLITFLLTVFTSGILALSARNFKLPNLPKLSPPNLSSLNPFKEQVIVVGRKGNEIDREKIETTKNLFKEETNKYSGMYAFYIYDLNGDYFYGDNYQETMQAASLIKLPVMAAAYLEKEKGNIDFEEYRPLIEAMGKRSDNQAFKSVVAKLGREKIEKTILDLGMTHTSLEDNSTTPEEIGMFFKKLYKYEILNQENSEEFLSFLTGTIWENWLRKGIPDEIRVAHKYGREVHVVNDAGVIFSQRPFVLVIMTDGVIEKEADNAFPQITRLLFENHTKAE